MPVLTFFYPIAIVIPVIVTKEYRSLEVGSSMTCYTSVKCERVLLASLFNSNYKPFKVSPQIGELCFKCESLNSLSRPFNSLIKWEFVKQIVSI